MCAIYGIVQFDKIVNENNFYHNLLLMKHRGPDDSGIWYSDNKKIAIGHNRLSILDLSRNGSQPMISNDKKIILTFNGEIYNYLEIKKDLLNKGYKFKSDSDTEVILLSYICYGERAFEKFKGCFAISILDLNKDIIRLVRDRAGEKPLFFLYDENKFIFSSEIRSIINYDKKITNLNSDSVINYLTNGYVSGSKTIFKNIFKLEPGNILEFDLNKKIFNLKNFWKVGDRKINELFDINLATEKLNTLLKKSVEIQLNADVEVGVLLSGGVDSSLITAIASQLNKNINTYTVSFPNFSKFDETHHARLISKTFRTNHTELVIDDINSDSIEKSINHLDEPLGDSSLIPTYLISELISKKLKVALGGDGADELFGGYNKYPRMVFLESLKKYVPNFLLNKVNLFQSFVGDHRKINKYLNLLYDNKNNHYPNLYSHFSNYEISNLLDTNLDEINKSLNVPLNKNYDDDILKQITLHDFNNYLREDILVKTDRSSMTNSLEIRSPFLDYDIIDFAFHNVNSKYKVRGSQKKIILKNLCKKMLPKEFDFSRKQGFSIPINNLIKKDRDFRDYFYDNLINRNSFFNKKYIHKLFEDHDRGFDNSEKLFCLLVFERCRRNNLNLCY